MTVTRSLPRDSYQAYVGTTNPPLEYNTRQWIPQRQQVLHVILPTEGNRHDRIIGEHERKKLHNAVVNSELEVYQDFDRRNLRPRQPESSQNLGGQSTQPKRQDDGRLDTRMSVEDVQDPCEQASSRILTTNYQRRSPQPSIDSDRTGQQRLPTTAPCNQPSKPIYQATTSPPYRPSATTTPPPYRPSATTTPRPYRPPPRTTTSYQPSDLLTTTSARPASTLVRPTTTVTLGDIIFPDGQKETAPLVPRTTCFGSTFCEKDEMEYPKDYINKLLRNEVGVLRGLFGQDVVSEPNITQRIDMPDETPLCQSVEQVVFPKTAQNKDNKWLFIVNQDQYTQGVRVESCLKSGPCMMADGFPLGYKTHCKQKYIYRKMIALTEDRELSSDSFKLPSCCSCQVKVDPQARMAALFKPLQKNITPAAVTQSPKKV